jgi:hypothetical protein
VERFVGQVRLGARAVTDGQTDVKVSLAAAAACRKRMGRPTVRLDVKDTRTHLLSAHPPEETRFSCVHRMRYFP